MSFNHFRNGGFQDIQWSSLEPLTLSDIQKMRKEFWETAYAYEGYKETWEILKKCIEYIQNNRAEEAQELLLIHGIIIPNGNFSECYNELGYKFELPNYVLNLPRNLKTEAEKRHCELPKDNSNEFYATAQVRLSDSRNFSLDVDFSDTVRSLMTKLSKLANISEDSQRWYFDGKQLHREALFRNYHISSQFVVQVIIHKPIIPEQCFDN